MQDVGINIERYEALITQVEKPAAGSDDEGKPALIFYWGVIVNCPHAGVFTRKQPIRRISTTARIVPGEINDPCQVVFVNGILYLDIKEGIASRECTGG
jgi:hypothetical protein